MNGSSYITKKGDTWEDLYNRGIITMNISGDDVYYNDAGEQRVIYYNKAAGTKVKASDTIQAISYEY